MSDETNMTPQAATDVTTRGARGDGEADDAPAIQRALNDSRFVHVPPGVYRIGRTLRIGSGTRLDVHPAARLVFADVAGADADCFLLTNSDHEAGNERITVRGGVWDGNNRGNPRPAGKLIDPGAYTGVMINFRNVRGLTFGDAMLCDSESYHVRCTRVDGFLVENVRFHSTRSRPNNDGIHLGGHCENGIIRRLRGLGPHAPSDDLVALNADDVLERIEGQGKLYGPIRNVVVHDLQADQCHTFVRLLSVVSPIENIDISHLRGGFEATVINMDAGRYCRVPLFDPAAPKYADGVGACRNIRIRDVEAFAAGCAASQLIRMETRVEDLLIEQFVRDAWRDGSPGALTLRARNLPGHRIELEGLTDRQLAALREASDGEVRSGALTGQVGMNSAAMSFADGDAMVLPGGGFRRLSLTRLSDRPGGR